MPQKIFISYRREDSAANALGIGQYLENEFGRKNVFIDIDMRAGTKFPAVLERRLAECKVMLVLIGPGWLNALDEKGQRRLDNPDDWVHLEISHALKRNITVIPVRVGGIELPLKAALPDDLKDLLDHQAASVSTAGFRHDMAGLARDIRSIPGPSSWRRFGSVVAGLFLPLLVGLALAYNFGLTNPESFRRLAFSTSPQAPVQKGMWSSRPGEWVLYGYTDKWLGYYFQPSSVKTFANAVVYTARFPTKVPTTTTNPSAKALPEPAYEDDTTVIDCQKSNARLAERTVYSESGEIISHYKFGDPQTLDLSTADPVRPGSLLHSAAIILCDEQLRTPLLSKKRIADQISEMKLSYLIPLANGEEVFSGPIKTVPNRNYEFEALIVGISRQDRSVSELLSGNNLIGLPVSFRAVAQTVQTFCKDRRAQSPKVEYYDAEGNLTAVIASYPLQPQVPVPNSPFEAVTNKACGPNVAGTYEGTNSATYEKGGQGDQKISITIEQASGDLNVSFQTANGAQGKGSGKLMGNRVESFSLESTTPECPGSYKGSMEFPGDTVTWSYKGEDCGGPMEGHGTAKKVKS
jgi:hypothetical protein